MLIALGISWVALQKPLTGIMYSAVVSPENQNPYIQEYALPDGTGPNGLIVDNDGTVWVTSSKTDMLYSFNQNSGKLGNYEVKDSMPYFGPQGNGTMVWTMVQGKDGTMWFSPLGTGSVWRFDPVDGKFQAFSSPAGSAFQMKVDKNSGNVWFTTLSGDALGVIERDPNLQSGYKVASFYLGNGTAPAGLYLQNDTVWVTEITTQKLVKYHIEQENGMVSGVKKVLELPLDNYTQLSSPTDIVVTNNLIWLTEHETSLSYKI